MVLSKPFGRLPMKQDTKFKSAIKRYNAIMNDNGYEYLTIGERLSEGSVNTLEDMIKEVRYLLSTFYEEGHVNGDMMTTNYSYWYKQCKRMNKFLSDFEEVTDGKTV